MNTSTTASTKPQARKQQILETLAQMLESPKREKITTALLAARLDVSEAALYRHFASKIEMFSALIEFIETTIFSLINQICQQEENGLAQVHSILSMLASFAEKNPGITRVMTGDALAHEERSLQTRINGLIDKIDMALRQSLRLAATQGYREQNHVPEHASLLTSFMIGLFYRFTQSGFQKKPTEELAAQLRILLG